MRPLALGLCVIGCVESVTVARVPDVGVALPDGGATAPVIEGTVVVTATSTADRARMVVDLDLATVRARGAVRAVTLTPEGGRALLLEPRDAGRFGARTTGYSARWLVEVADAAGPTTGELELPAPFTFTSPRAGERVSRASALTVMWAPFGDAAPTLLSPDGPRAVPDTGTLVIPRDALGDDASLRMQREWLVSLRGAVQGALRVRIVNEAPLLLE